MAGRATGAGLGQWLAGLGSGSYAACESDPAHRRARATSVPWLA